MKILWFTLTPCGSIRRKSGNAIRAGWLISLEDAIKQYTKDIQLTVAYVSSIDEADFYYDGVHYIPMFEGIMTKNPFVRIKERVRSNQEKGKRLLPLMINAIEKSKPDLIHIHGTEERFGLVADYIHNIPIAYSIQGLIAPYKEKYWAGIPQSEIRKHETFTRKIRNITYERRYKDFQERAKRELHYLENARYILGRTFWDRRIPLLCNPNIKYYQAEELLRPDFYTKQWQMPNNNHGIFRIVSTISGAPYKGHETILHAAALLKRFAHFNFEWIVAGCTENDYTLLNAEKYKGIKASEKNVRLAGFLNSEKLSQLLFSANVYCQVSHIENSPNSLCEALLLGIPTIASFAGGTASLTKGDESEALLYQDGDPYILAGSIVDVHEHYDEAIQRGKKARETAMLRHTPPKVAEQYHNIYKDIISDFEKRSI